MDDKKKNWLPSGGMFWFDLFIYSFFTLSEHIPVNRVSQKKFTHAKSWMVNAFFLLCEFQASLFTCTLMTKYFGKFLTIDDVQIVLKNYS